MSPEEARSRAGLGPEWEEVTAEETREIGNLCVREKRVFNGCTSAELHKRYGADNVQHVMGFGWFKRRPA